MNILTESEPAPNWKVQSFDSNPESAVSTAPEATHNTLSHMAQTPHRRLFFKTKSTNQQINKTSESLEQQSYNSLLK